MRKIILLIVILVSSVFADTEYENFTEVQRFLASMTNNVTGLGSLLFMDDIKGAAVQWVLTGSGALLLVYTDVTCDRESSTCLGTGTFITGFMLLVSSTMWGIFHPFFYDKPKPEKATYYKNDGFNMVILPNKQGDFKAYLFYNIFF